MATSSKFVKEDFYKAKLELEIPSDVNDMISSEFFVGQSKFSLKVWPAPLTPAILACLCNESNHDVGVDYTISANGCELESWDPRKECKIEKNRDGRWWGKFMRAREDLNITVEVTLKWEDVPGGMDLQVKSSELTKVEERMVKNSEEMLKQKIENSEENMKQEIEKSEERMKQEMKQEIENSEDRMKQEMKQEIENSEERMKQEMMQEIENSEKRMKQEMKRIIRGVKTLSIPKCPVCFQHLAPPKKIVQCLKVG